jgi:hypothetical protein
MKRFRHRGGLGSIVLAMAWLVCVGPATAPAQTPTPTPPFPIHEIRGVLISDYDRAPMPGVRVTLDWNALAAGYPSGGLSFHRDVTATDGSFVIKTYKPPELPFQLTIRNPLIGSLLLMQTPTYPSTPSEPIELHCSIPPGWIAGRLIDGGGQPIGAGVVYLLPSGSPTSDPNRPNSTQHAIHRTSPDADGLFVLGPAEPGQYDVLFTNGPLWFEGRVIRRAVATHTMDRAAENRLDLVVSGSILELRVADEAGQAVKSFRLKSRRGPRGSGSDLDLRDGLGSGVVRLAGYPPGQYFFSAIGEDGFGVWEVNLEAGPDGTVRTLTIPYRRGRGRITGVALAAPGRSARSGVFIVSMLHLSGVPMSGLGLQWGAPVDEHDRFVSRPLPPGDYRILGREVSSYVDIYHAGDRDTEMLLNSMQQQTSHIEIEVVDRVGQPVAGATVHLSVRSRSGSGGSQGLTDDVGSWRKTLESRALQSVIVEVVHPEYSTTLTPEVPYTDGMAQRLVLDPAADLRVVVAPADEDSSRTFAADTWRPALRMEHEIPFHAPRGLAPPTYPTDWMGEMIIKRVPRGVSLKLDRSNRYWELGELLLSSGGRVLSRGEVFTIPREGPATEFRLDVPLRLKGPNEARTRPVGFLFIERATGQPIGAARILLAPRPPNTTYATLEDGSCVLPLPLSGAATIALEADSGRLVEASAGRLGSFSPNGQLTLDAATLGEDEIVVLKVLR